MLVVSRWEGLGHGDKDIAMVRWQQIIHTSRSNSELMSQASVGQSAEGKREEVGGVA